MQAPVAQPERRIVSVLFADLVGFTSLSESLDAEDVLTVQDAYFDAVRDTVARHRGALEKFVGDAVVAVFGVPRTEDDDTERAVAAGLALAATVEHLSGRLGLDRDALRLRVGVNTGEVLVSAGGPDRGPVTGDTVNVAARLQAAAPPGGVLVGPLTALAVSEGFELAEPEPLALKGKAEPVRAALVLGARETRSRAEAMAGLRAPLLGRDVELSSLTDALHQLDGAARLVVVVAPPGTGKTRLVDELERAVPADVAVTRARARPDALAPFEPVRQLVAAAAEQSGGEALMSSLAAALGDERAAAVAEELELLLGEARPAATARGADDRAATFDAWLDGLDALARAERELWVVEDVHWAGGDTLAFLRHAGARAGTSRLVVATARPALLERLDPDGASVMELPPLSAPDTAGLVCALVGDALPDSLVDSIAERADGNPLFVEELLRTWIAVGLLVQEGSSWRLTASPGEVPLPATVQAIYAAQIDDLPPDGRELARRAAVAGRRFPVAALLPLGVPEPTRALEPLLRRSLVSGPERDPVFGDTFRYRHALLRDAGYASLARAERARLHARLAGWLEASSAEPELVGRHYASAAESAPALASEVDAGLSVADASRLAGDWLERAAVQALELAGFETATDALRRSLAHTPEEQTLDRVRRLRLLGETTAFGASMDEGAARLEEALELVRAAFGSQPSPEARTEYADVVRALGRVRNQQIRFAEAAELAGEALAAIGEAQDAETGWLLTLRGFSAYNATDEVEGPVADHTRALAIARAVGSRPLELRVTEQLLAVDESASAADWRAFAELALAEGRHELAARALGAAAQVLLDDEAATAPAVLDEADRIAVARGLTEHRAWNDYARAEAFFMAGDWDAALEAGERAVRLGEEHGYHRAVVRTWHTTLPVAAARGDRELLARAQAWYAARSEELSRVDSLYGRIMSSANHVRFAAAGLEPPYVPDPESRIPGFGLTYGGPSTFAALETIVDAWLAAGDLDAVRAGLEELEQAQPAMGSILSQAILDFFTARLLEHDGSASPVEPAHRAFDGFRRVGAVWWEARAIRVLERAGASDAKLAAELAAAEAKLRAAVP